MSQLCMCIHLLLDFMSFLDTATKINYAMYAWRLNKKEKKNENIDKHNQQHLKFMAMVVRRKHIYTYTDIH